MISHLTPRLATDQGKAISGLRAIALDRIKVGRYDIDYTTDYDYIVNNDLIGGKAWLLKRAYSVA